MDSRMFFHIFSIYFKIDELPGDKNQWDIIQQLDILISKSQSAANIIHLWKDFQKFTFFKEYEVEEITSLVEISSRLYKIERVVGT